MSGIRILALPETPTSVRTAVRHGLPAVVGLSAFVAGLAVAVAALARLAGHL